MNSQPITMDRVDQYLAQCGTLGYEMQGRRAMLRRFVAFVSRRAPGSPVTTALALEWATQSQFDTPVHQARKLSAVRTFARYCAVDDPRTEVPPENLLGKTRRRPAPYIYSPQEIQSLLNAAWNLRPPDALRPQTYAVLLGLLACTGIRIGEAIRLRLGDVRWQEPALIIRDSKRLSERLVPLHDSAANTLQAYVQRRSIYLQDASCDRFFINDNGGPLCHDQILRVFRRLRANVGIGGTGRGQPRIHDLRHTFACRRVIQWQRDGVPLDKAITSLSTYLGHIAPTDTYWYLTGIRELLQACGERFEQYAERQAKGGQA